jgi:hypothetical protein
MSSQVQFERSIRNGTWSDFKEDGEMKLCYSAFEVRYDVGDVYVTITKSRPAGYILLKEIYEVLDLVRKQNPGNRFEVSFEEFWLAKPKIYIIDREVKNS